MKRLGLIVLLAAFIAGCLFFGLRFAHRNDEVEWHVRAWNAAVQESVSGCVTFWDQFKSVIGRQRAPEQRMRDHERALFDLGYLTTHAFMATNQVLTREFYSNFVRNLMQTFGTNGECVWTMRGFGSTGPTGILATLPVKDMDEWERIFRECAAKYAFNVPPVLSTNESRP